MQVEFEAKIPKIDKDQIRQRLRELGAKLVFPEQKFIRMTFDNQQLRSQNTWVRLRDEGDRLTMVLKVVTDEHSIHGMKEVELVIDNLKSAKLFLEQLGLKQKNYQENLREEWKMGDVIFDIDTWPLIDPYLEIEGPNEEVVRKHFDQLGLDYTQAVFGSVDVLYRDVYGIDILSRKALKFE